MVFGRESTGIEVSRSDRFVATTWWTAHIAHDAVRRLGGEHFLYLIQEYEPFTFPMGTYAALAEGSYRFPHAALFSTELLRDWFRRRGIGVYAEGAARRRRALGGVRERHHGRSSRPPPRIWPGARPGGFSSTPGPSRTPRATCSSSACSPWSGRSWTARSWTGSYGIGTVNPRSALKLGHGTSLELVPRREQGAYAELLRDHDVGLSLMYTPHPSLVPIEMAAAGMLTVTNSFENKTPDAMAEISTNLITVDPTLEGIVAGLRRATERVEDFEARARGARVRWSRDW